MISTKLIHALQTALVAMPTVWNSKAAIIEMKQAGYSQWRQMEWIGWYFEFLCTVKLFPTLQMPGPKLGKTQFDGFAELPWDFKVHPNKDAKGKESNYVVINDRVAIRNAIKKFGGVGLVLATGDAAYNDKDRSFQMWHQQLKGGMSEYEKRRILRKAPSRLRKTLFELKEIKLIIIDDKTLRGLGSFQKGFRNSDGSPRKVKAMLDLNKIVAIKTIRF